MNYFTNNQAECIIQNYISILNQNAEKFKSFKFETIVKVLKKVDENAYSIYVIITNFGEKTSRDIEFHEFCINKKIPIDYTICIE